MADNVVTIKVNLDSSGVVTGARQVQGTFGEVFKAEVLANYFQTGLSLATEFFTTAIQKANEFQTAMLGLQSIAAFKGIDTGDAAEAVKNLEVVKLGLVTVADASAATKNLLQTNYTLEQSIQFLNAWGNSAATARQSGLSYGEALKHASEGVRLGLSNLADAAGTPENLSQSLKKAGIDVSEVGNLSENAAARIAILAGVLRQAAASEGVAAQYAETGAGAQAQFSKALNDAYIAFGSAIEGSTAYKDTLKLLSDQLTGAT